MHEPYMHLDDITLMAKCVDFNAERIRCEIKLDELHAEYADLYHDPWANKMPYQELVTAAITTDINERIRLAEGRYKNAVLNKYLFTRESRRRGLIPPL